MKVKIVYRYISILFISSIILINGCSGPVGEFFSVRYQNVMGYFNTYYNAKKAFDDAITELKKNPPKDLDTNYFAQYIANQSVKTKFNLVLEKASKILQFYPKSKWFDDALMMIGEIYYYQDEGELAIKKFEELIDNFPRSKHIWRAHSLYARTLYYNESYERALTYIDKIFPEATINNEDIAIELTLLKAQILYEQKQYEKSIKSLDEALIIDGDEYLLAVAAYLKGRINEVTQNYNEAKLAYSSVLNFDPDKNLEFKSKLSYARMLREVGEYQKALDYFLKMRKDEISQENLSYIDLEIARTHEKMGELETALTKYEMVDSLYKKTDASAKSFYYRGLMYEQVYDFNEAKFYYDKAKAEFPQSEITEIAQKKSEIFSKLLQYRSEILKYDSLYLNVTDTSKVKIDSNSVADTLRGLETTTDANATSIADTLLSEKIDSLEEDLLLEPIADETTDQSNLKQEITKVQTININPDSLLFLKTKNQMELATIFFLDLNLLDSAEYWFLQALSSKYRDNFAPKAYYSLIEIYKLMGYDQKADSFYNILVNEYPKSEYSQYVQKIRGENNNYIESDSEQLYEKALQSIENNKTSEAIKILRKIVLADTSSRYNIKSIYTMGWLYENILKNNDSAKFYYRILIDKYPQSLYTQEIVGKVAVAEDTSKLSQVIKLKEIVPPPPPSPKYVQTEQRDTKRTSIQQQQRDIRNRDIREEDYEEPDIEEPEIDEEEPPE